MYKKIESYNFVNQYRLWMVLIELAVPPDVTRYNMLE